MNRAILILGGNIGNRKKVLIDCILDLEKIGKIVNYSSIFESEPWGFEGISNFYNQVVEIETPLNAFELLKSVQNIEINNGRKRKEIQWTDRIIDIDILFFNEDIIQSSELIVPHKEIVQRRFVLEPLAELFPNMMHPSFKLCIADLLKMCNDKGKVWKIN